MIHPFIGLRFAGAVWYQGESNTAADDPTGFLGPTYYSCALPAMLSDCARQLQHYF